MTLQERIEELFDLGADSVDAHEARSAVQELMGLLNAGTLRAAEHVGGSWRANTWVKKGILLAFRIGAVTDQSRNGFTFFDKDTIPLKTLTLEDRVRIVPGGTSVRDGAYVAPGVVMMPPSYVNIGAYVGEQTMIDSHALVGSCAQIGRRVHLSAAAQIGGVLEPIGSVPVVVEDDVFIGGNCGIYEGTIIRERAVIGAGVILTGSTPVYDLVQQEVLRRTAERPLIIPEGALVIPGSRRIEGPFADKHQLSLSAAIIIKYRDGKTDAATILEQSLR